MDDILSALNNKLLVGGIFCDLEKNPLTVWIIIYFYQNWNFMELQIKLMLW